MTHVTCRLSAKNRHQLRNPTLGNRVWATFTFFYHAIKWFSEAYTQTDPLGGSTDAWLCVCGVIADDCFQLGKVAYNNEDFYHAIKWFSEALRLDEQETIKSSARHVVLDYLSYSVYMVRVTHTRAH